MGMSRQPRTTGVLTWRRDMALLGVDHGGQPAGARARPGQGVLLSVPATSAGPARCSGAAPRRVLPVPVVDQGRQGQLELGRVAAGGLTRPRGREALREVRRPQTSHTAPLREVRRPQTSRTAPLQEVRRPQTSRTAPLQEVRRPQTSRTAALQEVRRPQTSRTAALQEVRRPQTSPHENAAAGVRRPQTSRLRAAARGSTTANLSHSAAARGSTTANLSHSRAARGSTTPNLSHSGAARGSTTANSERFIGAPRVRFRRRPPMNRDVEQARSGGGARRSMPPSVARSLLLKAGISSPLRTVRANT